MYALTNLLPMYHFLLLTDNCILYFEHNIKTRSEILKLLMGKTLKII